MNLKDLLPIENYVITTRLSVAEVLKRIGDNIQPKQGFTFSSFNNKYSRPYSGRIMAMEFTMSRNINYRNSFLPLISGQITTSPGLTHINVKMRPVTPVLIFIGLWLGIVGLLCIGMLVNGLLHITQIFQNGFSPMTLIPFGMFVFGSLLTHFAFKWESKKSKEFLAKLLDDIDS